MSDPLVEGPRLAREEDFPELLDLVDRCFHHPDGGMGSWWAHCYDESEPEQHAIIMRDGEVVSNVGCIRNTLLVDGGELPIAGITAVATDNRYRGNGYMTQLLEFWLDRIDELGIPFSELAGNRQRYGRFGWEVAGQDRHYRITDRSFVDPPERDEHVRRYDGSDEAVDFVRDRYRTLRYRVARDREAFRTRLGRGHLETVCYTEPGHESYLTFTRTRSERQEETITEVVGTARGVSALLAYVFRTFGKTQLSTRLHPSDPLNDFFGSPDVSTRWRTVPHRSVNVRDLPATLSAFSTQIEKRWRGVDGGDGTFTLGIEGDDEAAELAWTNSQVDVRAVGGNPDLSFDRMAMTRLLFGYPETVAGYDGHHFLDAVLPLEFYLPRTDQV